MAPRPGILWVASKITNPSLKLETLTKWYDEVHFPDILKTSGVQATIRNEALDPTVERPTLCYYPVRDIAFLQSEEFFSIPITSDLLPGPSHNILHATDFDIRYYELVQTYGPEGTKPGPGRFLTSTGMTPSPSPSSSPGADTDTDADLELDAWYRREHLPLVSHCSGYVRTRRFKLAADMQEALYARLPDGADRQLPPRWLALHEFSGETLPSEELGRTMETSWARSVREGCLVYEVGGWRFVNGEGSVEGGF